MHRGRARRAAAVTTAFAVTLTGLIGLSTTTAGADPAAGSSQRLARDTREVPAEVHKNSKIDLSRAEQEAFEDSAPAAKRRAAPAPDDGATGTPVGGSKNWLVLGLNNSYSPAGYTLRGIGDKIEIWVQSDINYPAGDCRNDGVRNVITDAQVQSMITEFDGNILPKESEVFSVAPERDGTQSIDVGFGAPLWQLIGGGDPNYFKGDGDKTVVLVSNVRDENFYEPTSPAGSTYIAGFFSPLFNEGFDRNVMTIDSYDWLHRTGANPPDETPGGLCSPKQAARPHDYEGTFAHEYQHLLEYYAGPGEHTWLNEGLSDYAQTVVGYADTTLPYGAVGADSHLTCFQGFLGSDSFPYCGAENSLTRWDDQPNEGLADYGAAYSFVTYLADQFGEGVITYLHNADAPGLRSLQDYLDDNAPGLKTAHVVHDWAAQMAVDRLADQGARGLSRDEKNRFTSKQLNSAIDWAWTGSFDSPGAPANGSDYVLAIADRPVTGLSARSLDFTGAKRYAPDPLEWVINDDALWAGEGDDLDRSIVYPVSVPAGGGELTLSSRYDIEANWDFGLVQVSTDGGKTYTTIGNDNTTSEHADGADPAIVAQLPGLTGLSDGYQPQSYDLSDYAGQEVLVSFRYMTDGAANGNGSGEPSGWWIRDVTLDGTVITDGSSLEGGRSASQVNPMLVADWRLQLVGWTLDGKTVRYADVPLSKAHKASLNQSELRRLLGRVDRIGVIVTVDDPQELANKNANYKLKVNGVLQPGGQGNTAPLADGALAAGKAPVSHRLKVTIG
ncbi:immune inhibitor A domain-containing protein [Microlunatus speluncae]|uniref:immune inhibitor A domain-containing protein n=1 Tax=Microlunatus speluncae TaxID=2594267 RepID=UPI0013759ADE|nr:immune inhibitor A domain-containing protein [Microlunatus speluncae]